MEHLGIRFLVSRRWLLPACCCAHKDTALPDGETPWPWRTNGIQNTRFPGPERPFWNLLEKVAILAYTCYTFLDFLMLLCPQRHGPLAYTCYTFLDFLMLLCPQRHGPPGRGNTMALKDKRSPKYAFPGAGTSLLKSPRKSLLYAFLGFSMLATGSCCCCCAHKDTALPDGETPWPWRTNGVQNTRFPGPERLFWNLLEKACYLGFSMLATGSGCCCCCCAHKDTALPDGETPWPWRTNGVQNKRFPGTRPSRTGKHHGPEGRTASKIRVSRGRNVSSEIS